MEDKDNNNTGTVGVDVGETAAAQKNTGATSDGSSIGAHVSNVNKTNIPSTQSIHELLTAHPVEDPIWDRTNSCNILINTVNSAETVAGIHSAEQEYRFCNSNAGFEYTKHVVNVTSNIIEEDGLYKFMENYDKWDNLPNIAVANNDTGSSHTFRAVNTSGSVNKSIKLHFWIGKRQS